MDLGKKQLEILSSPPTLVSTNLRVTDINSNFSVAAIQLAVTFSIDNNLMKAVWLCSDDFHSYPDSSFTLGQLGHQITFYSVQGALLSQMSRITKT